CSDPLFPHARHAPAAGSSPAGQGGGQQARRKCRDANDLTAGWPSRAARGAAGSRQRSSGAGEGSRMKAVLLESHELAPEVRHFLFETPDVQQLHFKAGQFVSLSEVLRSSKFIRAYWVASLPAGNRFELCLNCVQDGIFSPHLFEMKPGDSVEMTAPLGFFTIRNPAREAVFVATGTGIAPFRPMV